MRGLSISRSHHVSVIRLATAICPKYRTAYSLSGDCRILLQSMLILWPDVRLSAEQDGGSGLPSPFSFRARQGLCLYSLTPAKCFENTKEARDHPKYHGSWPRCDTMSLRALHRGRT